MAFQSICDCGDMKPAQIFETEFQICNRGGAKLYVIDENNEVIDEWTSTNKTHKIEGLKVGKTYTLREDLAPIGYAKSTDIKFKVENTGKVQKVTMIDKIVEISKTGDNSAVRLVLGVMLLAFLGIAWGVIKIFKKKDNK